METLNRERKENKVKKKIKEEKRREDNRLDK
jgi:hypothetical protein